MSPGGIYVLLGCGESVKLEGNLIIDLESREKKDFKNFLIK